ncbi:MAG TPA: alkaline phytoceramidase [Verrucomicrobiota bacterium]|nr:alkaline phytoceramidase [Verrucomicrobiota bacterium]
MNESNPERRQARRLSYKVWIIIALAAACSIAVFSYGPIPQSPEYSQFADHRGWLGIPNFLDVASNVFFLWIGVAGLMFLTNRSRSANAFATQWERVPYFIFFIGVLGTTFGSSWFHLRPDNASLVWDRLPMTLAFMGFFTAMIGERISLTAARRLLWPLVIFGIGSVGYWYWTELTGKGDLRPYVLVQFFPMLAVPLMLAMFRSRYAGGGWLVACLLLYGLAKGLEMADQPILDWLGISGHTLKHIASAAATWAVLQMLRTRSPIRAFP